MTRSRIERILFPDPPRDFRWRRGSKLVLRAVHVLCATLLMGSHLFAAGAAARQQWLIAALGSGLLLLALDLHETAAVLLQLRGAIVVGKLAVLGALGLFEGWEGWILGLVVMVSVVSSHAPSAVRYRLLVGKGRIRASSTKG